jgi:hypothetical protein
MNRNDIGKKSHCKFMFDVTMQMTVVMAVFIGGYVAFLQIPQERKFGSA